MTRNKFFNREGFQSHFLRTADVLNWQEKDVDLNLISHLPPGNEREELFEKYKSVNECASDLLNILENKAAGADIKIIFETMDKNELYFARRCFINTCSFVGIKCPKDVSMIEKAKEFAERVDDSVNVASLATSGEATQIFLF